MLERSISLNGEITAKIDLADIRPGQVPFWVWINPPADLLVQLRRQNFAIEAQLMAFESLKKQHPTDHVLQECRNLGGMLYRTMDATFLLFAQILSKGPKESRVTAKDLHNFHNEDPAFLFWLLDQAVHHIHRYKLQVGNNG